MHAHDGNEELEGFVRRDGDRGIDGHLALDLRVGNEVPARGFAHVADELMYVRFLEIEREAPVLNGGLRCGSRGRREGSERGGQGQSSGEQAYFRMVSDRVHDSQSSL